MSSRKIFERKEDVEGPPPSDLALHFEAPTVALHDTGCDREAESQPLPGRFHGEEGLENSGEVLRPDLLDEVGQVMPPRAMRFLLSGGRCVGNNPNI